MASLPIPFDAEEFWDDLLAFIEDGRVIPVVGPELLTIVDGEQTVPLYRAAAERLLARYKLAPSEPSNGPGLRPNRELNDAVCLLAANGRRVKDLYRPIHDILQQILAEQDPPLPALRELASISHFNLFATTTPDSLLAQSLDLVRFNGTAETDVIEYAPGLPTDRRRDIPELRSPAYTAVFHLFGRADVSPLYAIHDEDTLEFAYTLQYTLQNGGPPARIFSELRSRNLLLLGCNFAGWLTRFFLRLSNEKRLSSGERSKKEYLVDRTVGDDRDLTVFLERFSSDSRCYPAAAPAFVSELYQRWQQRNPASARGVPRSAPGIEPDSMSGSIFISYASEDVDAAKRLCGALEQVGGDVAWLDKNALKPGDLWAQQIKRAIQRCHLFVPLISSTTERRKEGYFRMEWSEAADRCRRIQGRTFVVPVVIDPEFSGDPTEYSLVPDAFRAFQYSHAPQGNPGAELQEAIVKELRNMRRGRVA